MLVFDKQREDYQVVGCKQFDNQRPIKAQFFNNGQSLDLSQYYIRFECKKSDGNIVIDDENVSIKNINEIEMNIHDQITVVEGSVECQFVLFDKISKKQDTTFTFYIDVQQSVISSNGYSESVITVAERLNKDVIEAKDLHEKLTEDITLGEIVSEDLVNKNNDGKITINELITKTEIGNSTVSNLETSINTATQKKSDLDKAIEKGAALNSELITNSKIADESNEQLKQSILEAQEDIAIIESTGNETITLLASEWVYNNESKMYEKEINHNCASENIHVTCKTRDTKDALFLPWRIVDKNTILLKSDEEVGVIVNISARYYKPLNLETIGEDEIIDARENKTSLLENISRKINYEDFNGNTIN